MNETERLMEGNARYVSGNVTKKDLTAMRTATLNGQKPFVTIISCSDSRVVPEYIFDAGIGELFVVRLAGNIVDSCAMGSIEYGVEHLHTPLLVVLGHEKCGAVTAACQLVQAKNNIDFVLEKIKPAIGRVGRDNVENTIDENVKCTLDYIVNTSKEVKHLVEQGKLKLVGMKYSFATGKVELIK
jgi:carbonic anhydrase